MIKFVINTTLTETGSTPSNQFQLPLRNGTYNCTVDWGDTTTSTITSYNQADTLHTYASGGVYTITITGTRTRFSFYDEKDKGKLTALISFDCAAVGQTVISSVFYECSNLLDGGVITNTSNVTSFYRTWYGCSSMTSPPDTSGWDTSKVTTFSGAWYGCSFTPHDTDQLLVGLANSNPNNYAVSIHLGNSKYSPLGEEAKSQLESLGWIFTDSGLASPAFFIPGIPNSNLCADGSIKTIQPGYTSPYTLIDRDQFNAPELVGLGCDTPFESTDKEHLIAPLNTKFATNKNGSKTRLLTYDTSIDEHPNYPFIGVRKAKGTTMRTIKSGTTQPYARIELSDSTGPVTDVSHSTPGLSIKYKVGNAAAVTLTPVAMTASNYTSGGIYHAGNGTYMIGLPAALVTAASHDPISVWVELADVDSSRDEIQVVAYDATQVAVGAITTHPPIITRR